jgi:hypothetical protein
MIDASKKELISLEVIRCLVTRFEKFPEDVSGNRNAPFHEAFLNAFSDKLNGLVSSIPVLISLSSWVHGLNTTLGQSFFENVAHILSDGEKHGFTTKLGTNLKIKESQQTIISDLITELKSGSRKPNLSDENSLIFSNMSGSNKDAVDFTADNFVEDRNLLIGIEIKTVKPNSGVFQNEKFKILNAKAALKNHNPTKEIKYYLAFPFDPTSATSTGSDKGRFMRYSVDFIKYFDPKEVLLADELWNFLSGDSNTMQQLLDIINYIASTNFMQDFNLVNNLKNINIDKEKYESILKKWNLSAELGIFSNHEKLVEKSKSDLKLAKFINQNVFKNDGSINLNRIEYLSKLTN